MAIAQIFMSEMENISYHVAAGKVDKELLLRIIIAIMGNTYDLDEELKLEIYNAIQ
jgi:death-on-curing protein